MKRALVVTGFILVLALVCHFSFSWMGFTPTDEGFTLAHSRRILEGQVPHRDFIIIRPFVSPLLHVPEVWLGGGYTFWISRLVVWFQFACLAAAWTIVCQRFNNRSFSVVGLLCSALICFAATVHTKHLTAWHTIDGLFLFFVGLSLCTQSRSGLKSIGYFVLGLAPLCKQGFVFVIPGVLLLLDDWRLVKYWLAALLPGFLYLGFLLVTGAFSDAIAQLTSHTEFVATAILTYAKPQVLISAGVGFCAAYLLKAADTNALKCWTALTILYFVPLIGTAVSLFFGHMISDAFFLFGLCLGVAFYEIVFDRDSSLIHRGLWLALLAAWTASISGGYNSPALGAGPMLVAILSTIWRHFSQRRVIQYSLPGICALVVGGFVIGRVQHIYRDQPAARLNQSIKDVMPGGKRIYTNPNTHAFLDDLRTAIAFVEQRHRKYAIIPDVAAYWVKSPQRNPFPAIWPQFDELRAPRLRDRYLKAMNARRSDTTVIVQKVAADNLANGFVSVPDGYCEAVRFARQNFQQVHETKYFILYE
jgi:hypothetical protein